MDAYHRAQNCDNLVSMKVNLEIWAKIKPEADSSDVKIQRSQIELVKAAVAISSLSDILRTAKTNRTPIIDVNAYIKTAPDVVTLVASANLGLNLKKGVRP